MIGRQFLNRYEVLRLLGEGGMGRVYLAQQTDLNRQVVIKVMNDSVASDKKFLDRFEREMQLMARFQHPYVVTLYDASLSDPSGPCIVMEYVRGNTLDQLLTANNRLPAARVGRLVGQLCEALQAAHDEGIIHRDLKPSNIMVVEPDSPRERIKVMDFGLAKMLHDDVPGIKKVSDTGMDFAVGTPGYICPEQVRGDPVDHRGDLYSVGVIAFELLTGRLPFLGPNPMDMVLAHANDEPPHFAQLNVEVHPEIENLVFACLAKNPEGRPQSAAALAELLDLALLRITEADKGNLDGELQIPDDPNPQPRPFEDMAEAPADDPNALEFNLEAWMPKKIALLKLRGFVDDNGGEVLESTHGMIRVRFESMGMAERPTGPLRWLRLGRRRDSVFLDLKMTSHAAKQNLLQIQARFRTENGAAATGPDWRRSCVLRFIDLRSYLIGAMEAE